MPWIHMSIYHVLSLTFQENNSQCGGAISILPSIVLTAAILVISIVHNSQVVFS